MAKRSPSPARKTAAKEANAAGSKGVTVRHYCQGIGDCHLLKFTKADKSDFWMLIDCGVHSSVTGGTQMIAKIVEDIASVTKRLDVVVVTHEHWDHVSGFLTEVDRFKKFEVGEVWMGWTENPRDAQARELDKFKQQALAALQMASNRLDRTAGLSSFLSSLHEGVDAVLGFSFGAKGERVRLAREAAGALAPNNVHYLEPSDPPIRLADLPNLRIYVLGPPRDAALLGLTVRTSEMYGLGGAGGWPIVGALAGAFQVATGPLTASEDHSAPFDPNVGTDLSRLLAAGARSGSDDFATNIVAFAGDHYSGPARERGRSIRSRRRKKPDANETDQSWRRIDMDWLGVAADLAMQIDDRTNNTSLVLAFEFMDTKRVLLFAADAQVGNWLSWQDLRWPVDGRAVTGPDLLARAVYYKVGHHGSENATLKAKGLQLMISKDLSAFIPTNKKDAKKVKWGRIPFDKILDALHDKCGQRVIRADDPWIATTRVDAGFTPPSGAIADLRHEPGLWVELDLF